MDDGYLWMATLVTSSFNIIFIPLVEQSDEGACSIGVMSFLIGRKKVSANALVFEWVVGQGFIWDSVC